MIAARLDEFRANPNALADGFACLISGGDSEIDAEAASLYLAELAHWHMAWLKSHAKK